MARTRRREVSAWPGFVDAMTALLLVVMFVLTIFMVAQSVLRARITTQDSALDALGAQVANLSDALGMERAKVNDQAARLATLSASLAAREAELGSTQAALTATKSDLAAAKSDLAVTEAARAALSLDLEAAAKRAEETLTLLAAAETAAARAAAEAATELDARAAALAAAQSALRAEAEKSLQAARETAAMNAQLLELRSQLASLQETLDAAKAKDAATAVQIEALGRDLNTALAQVASEQRKRAVMEEAERKRLEAENLNLEKFRSEFFGQLRQVLAGREGVRIVGDRFVFSSEVLFQPGAADLAPEGMAQIAGVAKTLSEVADQIPPGIDWIVRVDGHTDNVPLAGDGVFADNWELSQARALSVVRYMQEELGFPPNRLAATGFGEWQPVDPANTPEARAQNRRIELKLTER